MARDYGNIFLTENYLYVDGVENYLKFIIFKKLKNSRYVRIFRKNKN